MTYFGTAVRFGLTTIVLMLIGHIVSELDHITFGDAVLAALVIGALVYGVKIFLSPKNPTYIRGLVGFIVAGVVIWLGQFLVPHAHISLLAALPAAALIGLINYAIPNEIA